MNENIREAENIVCWMINSKTKNTWMGKDWMENKVGLKEAKKRRLMNLECIDWFIDWCLFSCALEVIITVVITEKNAEVIPK